MFSALFVDECESAGISGVSSVGRSFVSHATKRSRNDNGIVGSHQQHHELTKEVIHWRWVRYLVLVHTMG